MTILVRYDAACRALAEAKQVDEVKDIRDKAVAMQVYAKQAKDRTLIEDATEIRMRAERRAGELLREMEKNKGARSQLRGDVRVGGRAPTPPTDPTPKLADLGVTKTQSSRWQRLADLDGEMFESRVVAARKKALSGLNNVHRELKQREARAAYETRIQDGCTVNDLYALAASGYKAAVIYVDVPSRFDTYSGEGKQRSAERYYDTMVIDDLKAMGPLIQPLAAKDCALFYWTSGPQNANALEVIKAWGFDYNTWGFVWFKTKPSNGAVELEQLTLKDLHRATGFTTWPSTEVVLFATRGEPVRLNNDVRQVVIAPHAGYGGHSVKPEEVRRRIERLFPGPYLELYGRNKSVTGWTVWGNEVPREQFWEAAESPPPDPGEMPPIPDFLRRPLPQERAPSEGR
jgi:N6-adenosine-specific RNA methylase IME4